MNLSRSTRKQLIACELIVGLIDASRASNPSNTRVDQILRRLHAQQQRIRSMLIPLGSRGQMVFESRKAYDRYQAEVVAIQNAILGEWPEEELDGREYVNALLAYCDQLARGRTEQDWRKMEGMLQSLYEELDPALEAEKQMEVGESAGEKLREAMEG